MNCYRAAAAGLAAALTLSLTAFAQGPDPAVQDDPVQTAIEAAAQYGGAVSIQYALWQDGEITLTGHAGVYSRTENRALTDDILYGVGSVSKVYTTAAVMLLAEEGKLDLDAPVTEYLPEFTMADARYEQITVRMLLNHSSGLMGTSQRNAFLFDDPDDSAVQQLLERLATQNLKADPGTSSVYCNDGFTLAQLVVERLSGQSLGEFLHEKILVPAGLEDTFVPADDFDASRLAKTYQGSDVRELPQESLGIVGTGGIYATASDLATFGGLFCGENEVLSLSAQQQTMADEYARGIWPEDTEDLLSYGLGWDSVHFYPFAYDGIQALAKGGDTLQYHAGLVVLPEYDMACAVLSSGGVSTYNEMAAAQILCAALAEDGITVSQSGPVQQDTAVPADMPQELMELAGYYADSTQQYTVGISEDGTLSLTALAAPDAMQSFTYYSDGSFRDETGTIQVKPVALEDGTVYLWQKACAQLPGLGVMPVSGYCAQRLELSDPGQAAQAAWDEANSKSYLLLNEKYTSQLYLSLGATAVAGEAPATVPGYMGSARIVDDSHTRFELTTPGTASRDGQESTLYEQDGYTWLAVQDFLFVDSSYAQEIWLGEGAYVTVGEDGYARWFQVGESTGGTVAVTLPEQGGFTAYAADGTLAASSHIYGDTSFTLPQGGWVVFAGEPGARFYLQMAE